MQLSPALKSLFLSTWGAVMLEKNKNKNKNLIRIRPIAEIYIFKITNVKNKKEDM